MLAVTPSLFNEENYVITDELPLAQKEKKVIIPAIMLETNQEDLKVLPECINAKLENELTKALFSSIQKIDRNRKYSSPEHEFFIGLAYLNGIDVEVNSEYAKVRFENAHQQGLLEATKQLGKMYAFGIGVDYDIYKVFEYEQMVLEKVRSIQISKEDKIRLANELFDMTEMCLSGQTDKIEPSPGKLLSIERAIDYYQELTAVLEEIAKEDDSEENIRNTCKSLRKLCCLIAGGGRQEWSNISYESEIDYLKKWVNYATMLAEASGDINDVIERRNSNIKLLEEMHYDQAEYEDTLQKVIVCSHEVFDHIDGGDYSSFETLFYVLYYNGLYYYLYNKNHEKVSGILHRCFSLLKDIELSSSDVARKSYMTPREVEFDLKNKSHQISLKSTTIIYDLVKKQHFSTNSRIIRTIVDDVSCHYDPDDIIMRDIIIPILKKLMSEN